MRKSYKAIAREIADIEAALAGAILVDEAMKAYAVGNKAPIDEIVDALARASLNNLLAVEPHDCSAEEYRLRVVEQKKAYQVMSALRDKLRNPEQRAEKMQTALTKLRQKADLLEAKGKRGTPQP